MRQVFPNRAHPAVLMARNFSAGATQDEKQAEKLAEKQRQEEEKERLKAEKAQKKLEEKAAKAEYRAQLKAQKEEEKKLLKEEKARIKAAEAEQKKKAMAARKREREEKREAKEAEKRMKKQKQELPKIAVKSSVSRLYKRCLQVARQVPDPSWQSTMTSYIRSSFRERTNTPLALKVSQGHAELKDFEEMLARSKLDKAARKAEMRKW